MIYLDNSATTRTLPEAAQAAFQAMTEDFYNPAAAYAFGARTEKRVNEARTIMARPLRARREEIIFTSGGTESNNAAVFGSLKSWHGPKRVITTAVEHPSVFETVQSLQQSGDVDIVILPVNDQGYPDLAALRDALTENTALVSMMHVNNELGTVTDLFAASRLIRRYAPRAIFHADGVQAYLKVDTDNLGVDLYSISAHKFHAPKGVGALYKRTGVRFSGGQMGGGQENNLRSGTLNVLDDHPGCDPQRSLSGRGRAAYPEPVLYGGQGRGAAPRSRTVRRVRVHRFRLRRPQGGEEPHPDSGGHRRSTAGGSHPLQPLPLQYPGGDGQSRSDRFRAGQVFAKIQKKMSRRKDI